MGVIVISTFGTGVPLKSLSTTITDIIPNVDSVGALSQEIELINKKQNNIDIISLIPMKGELKIISSSLYTILIIYSLNAENDNIKLAINI
jgi:hypothetical protein